MILSPELIDATLNIVRIVESLKAPYAVGGALSMQFLGYVRATKDVDILVLVPAIRSQEFADALNAAGFAMRDDDDHRIPVEVSRMASGMRQFGQFRIWWKEVKVELFSPKVPLQDSLLKRRRQVSLAGVLVWITTAEDLILLKMVFHRDKDLVDVRRLLAANRDSLDVSYLEGWIPKTLEPAVGNELREMMRRSGVGA